MPRAGGPLDFSELLVSMARGVAEQQARLDEDYRARLGEFGRLLGEAGVAVDERLLMQVAPRRLSINEVEIETTFRFAASRERSVSLGVALLNLGFSRRYAHAGHVENGLRVSVRRVELPQEPNPPKGKANG
jgi:hypothetical protein